MAEKRVPRKEGLIELLAIGDEREQEMTELKDTRVRDMAKLVEPGIPGVLTADDIRAAGEIGG